MLPLNLHHFYHQVIKFILISNPMGYVASPKVAQPSFEFKYDGNVQIQIWQVVVHDKHKQQAKHIQNKKIKQQNKIFLYLFTGNFPFCMYFTHCAHLLGQYHCQ